MHHSTGLSWRKFRQRPPQSLPDSGSSYFFLYDSTGGFLQKHTQNFYSEDFSVVFVSFFHYFVPDFIFSKICLINTYKWSKRKNISDRPKRRNAEYFRTHICRQIILELIRSAMTHKPITMFLTSLRSRKARSSDARRSHSPLPVLLNIPPSYRRHHRRDIQRLSHRFHCAFSACFQFFFQSKLRKNSEYGRRFRHDTLARSLPEPSIWVRPSRQKRQPVRHSDLIDFSSHPSDQPYPDIDSYLHDRCFNISPSILV